jgi:ABC-type uncharacterized transport system substrate-binding protein
LGSWYNEPAEKPTKTAVLLVFERKSYWLITTAGCIVTLAARHKLPTVYFQRIFVTSGGLISYGAHIVDQYRRAAGYVDRILKGRAGALSRSDNFSHPRY